MKESAVKRVLHIAHGLASYNNSLLELIRRLQAAGIEVTVASHVDLSAILAPLNVEVCHLSRDRDILSRCNAEIKACKGGKIQVIWRKLRIAGRYRRLSLENDEIAALITQTAADTVLIDMECHVAILTAIKQSQSTNFSIVLCSRWFSVFRAKELPPLHTLLQPTNALDMTAWQAMHNQFKIKVAWWQLALKRMLGTMRYGLSVRRLLPVVYETNTRIDLRALCRHLGLNFSALTSTQHWLMPHIYAQLPVLSLTPRALEFPQATDKRMHYVGAMVGRRNQSSALIESALSEFHAFVSRPEIAEKPLVYCSFSTFWSTSTERIAPVLDLFRRRSDLALVMGLGGKAGPHGLGELPDNILVLEYAPQIDILAHASVVISHGGISTINEALFHGVPLLLYSSGHVDQDGCMARVAYHKVGVAVAAMPVSAETLERSLDDLLNDSKNAEILSNVKRIQAQLHQYDQEQAALEMLNSARRLASGETV